MQPKKKLTKTQQMEEAYKSLKLTISQLENKQETSKRALEIQTKHLKESNERIAELEKALGAVISETENRIRRENEADKFNRRYFRVLYATLETRFPCSELTSLTEIAKYQGRMAMAREGLLFFGRPLSPPDTGSYAEGSGSCLHRAQAVLDGSCWEESDPFRNHRY